MRVRSSGFSASVRCDMGRRHWRIDFCGISLEIELTNTLAQGAGVFGYCKQNGRCHRHRRTKTQREDRLAEATTLRALLRKEGCLTLPGVYDGISARMAAS